MAKSSNTELWDRLGKTDPSHTSKFKRAGGFSGTAIKPIWSVHLMTEVYGPCGKGWGVNEPTFQVVHSGDEVLVYCTVSIWHGARDQVVFGVGGDKVASKNRNGSFTDDEAFKKAFTDAMTNAMKLIGVGADVHMGLFDDSKYVDSLRETPSGEAAPEEDVIPRVDGIQVLTRDAQRPIFSDLVKELDGCNSVEEYKRWKVSAKARASRLSGDWRDELNALCLNRLRQLESIEADEYAERMRG